MDITEKSGKIITRAVIVVLGGIAISMTFVVEHMGSVFEVSGA